MLVNLKSLFGRLNPTAHTVLEGAAGLCLSRTHYDVEVEHFLVKLLESPDSDFARIAGHFGIDKARLSAELTRSSDLLKAGTARTPAINPLLTDAVTKGWTYGSLELGATVIRTGFVVFALIADDELSRVVFEFSREMHKIEPEALRRGSSGEGRGVQTCALPICDRDSHGFRSICVDCRRRVVEGGVRVQQGDAQNRT